MRKLVLIGLTVTAVFAIAAVAVAQYAVPVVTVTASASPTKGGTKKKPKNASTKIKFNVNPESNSTLAGVDYGIPSNLKVSGAGFPSCTATAINGKGESACPKRSKVGTGAATALLGPGKSPIQFTVNVYAAGKSGLTLALKQTNGAVQVAFAATIKNNRVAFPIPSNVQQPVKGLYSYVTSVTANLGPAKITKTTGHGKHKKKKKYYLISRTGCSGGVDKFDTKLTLANNPNPPASSTVSGTATSACKK